MVKSVSFLSGHLKQRLNAFKGLFIVLTNESVTHTVLSNDNLGCFNIVTQLLSQVLDVYPEQVSRVLVSFTPDFTQQVLMCHQASFIPDEMMK